MDWASVGDWRGTVPRGEARIPRRGKVVRGTARHGSQGLGWPGIAQQGQQGAVLLRLVGQGEDFLAVLRLARQGHRGKFRQLVAMHGPLGLAGSCFAMLGLARIIFP